MSHNPSPPTPLSIASLGTMLPNRNLHGYKPLLSHSIRACVFPCQVLDRLKTAALLSPTPGDLLSFLPH